MIDIGEGWMSPENGTNDRPCGVFVDGRPEEAAASIPLRRREVEAVVHCPHGFAEVTETLSYVADEDCTVHFVFPLPPRAAVFRFKAVIGDREVVTEVKRKAQAQREYKEAVAQGHSAVLMKQAPSASLFTVDLGNLAAMEEAVITFSYVRVLDTVAGALEFVHTATWVPPYTGARDMAGHGTQEIAEDHPTFTSHASYSLTYRIKLLSDGAPLTVDSPSPIALADGQEGEHKCTVVKLAESVSDPSRDLSLLIELPKTAEAASSRLAVQECQRDGKTKTVALASFMPSLPEMPSGKDKPQGHELIFVVDGSGSMGGAPIEQALQAALFFVKDLPTSAGITFNACVFGSSHQMMWTKSRPYDSRSEKEAVAWLQASVHANWGGTEILSVLQNIYSTPVTPGSTRQIIFLTDGGVSGYEEQAILELMSNQGKGKAVSATARLTTGFCLGIGHGVHRGLVEAMAKQSGGVAAFVVDDESIAKKCAFLKKCALATGRSSCLVQPRLVARSALVRAAPYVLPQRVFPGEPLQVLVEVLKAEPGATLDLVGQLPDGSPHTAASLRLDGAPRSPGDAFAVLHAMALVGGLLTGQSSLHVSQDGTPLKQEPKEEEVVEAIVAAAVQEHLVTPHTSAVGVLLRRDPLEGAKRIEVPLQVPAGRKLWQQQQQQQQQQFQACYRGFQAQQMPPGNWGAPMLCQAAMAPAAALCAPPPVFAQCSMQHTGSGAGGAEVCDSLSPQQLTRRRSRDGIKQKLLKKVMPRHAAAAAAPQMAMAGGGQGFGAAPGGAPLPLASSAAAAGAALFGAAAPAPAAPPAFLCGTVAGRQDAYMSEGAAAGTDEEDEEEEELAASIHSPLPADDDDQPLGPAVCGMAPPGTLAEAEAAQQQAPASLDNALAALNLSRSVEGAWLALTPELLAVLAVGGADADAMVRAKPGGMQEGVWATVLVLAFLRKRLGEQRGVWQDMEGKALAWLGQQWGEGCGYKSVGAAVLSAMKLV